MEITEGRVTLNVACSEEQIQQWKPCLLALGEFLLEDEDPEVSLLIVAYEGTNIGGLRLSEVSWTVKSPTGWAGSSYMRGDGEELDFRTAAFFLCAEDFLETYGKKPHRPKGWTSFLNMHGESKIRLLELMEVSTEKEYKRQRAEEQELIGTDADDNR